MAENGVSGTLLLLLFFFVVVAVLVSFLHFFYIFLQGLSFVLNHKVLTVMRAM